MTDLARYGATLLGSEPERALLFQPQAVGLPEPQRELRFAPPRRWRFDLAYPEKMLAVEIEGGVWVSGRHSRGAGSTKDMEKYAEALCQGWRVLRVTPAQIDSGQALGWIERLLR